MAEMYFLGCLCCLVKVGQCFHASFLSVVYTNAGPLGLNNKCVCVWWGQKRRLLLSLSAKFGELINLIPPGICL